MSITSITKPTRRRKMTYSEVPIAKHDLMKSLRAYIANTLCGLKGSPLNRYETGLKEAFKEFANMLHPAGYHRDRSMSELISALRKPSTKRTMARLQNIRTVRSILDSILKGFADDPSDNRFLYGYEDAHWLLLGLVDPPIKATKRRETKHSLKSRVPLLKSLQRAWLGRE